MGSHHAKYAKVRPNGSTTLIYCRLIRMFCLKYWWALLIGILSSLCIGGAMASALRVMDVSFNILDVDGDAYRDAAQVKTTALPSAADGMALEEAYAVAPPSAADGMALEEAGTVLAIAPAQTQESRPGATARPASSPPDDKAAGRAHKMAGKINRLLQRFGMDAIDENAAISFQTVMLLMGILVVFFAVQSLGEWINRFTLKWLGARVVTDIRQRLFERVLDQSAGFFSRNEVGRLISRCSNDISAVETILSSSLPELCTAPVFILVALEFVISKAVELHLGLSFWLMLPALVLGVVPIYMLSRLLKRYQSRVLDGIAGVLSRMQEAFSGIMVIKAFNQEAEEARRFSKVNEDFFRRMRKAIAADVLVHPMLQFTVLGLATVFVLLCYRFHISLAALVIIGYALQQAYKPVKDLVKLNSSLQRSAAAAERIFQLLDSSTALPEPEKPVPFTSFHDRIVFRDVSFRYGIEPCDRPVLHHIDLAIPRGSQVALVGQTGCGKSTLALLLARFYDPVSGSITIDGIDLRNFKVDDFRAQVGMVSQDTFLFNTTIAENIRYGRPEAGDEEVRRAAIEANALEFIEQFPDGFNHVVGERGQLLSGGQRQRIAIARAILRNPPILILDEATSALDTVTERLVQDALNNVMKDRTVLAIAHRLSTIRNADQIVVMDGGRIIERGTHDELMAGGTGAYRRLYDEISKDSITEDQCGVS